MEQGTAIDKAYTKTETLNALAGNTGLAKSEVANVLEALSGLIERHIKKGGCGTFSLPGLFKIQTTRKPATPERDGINPFTKEPTVFKAKPARTVIKIRPLKNLKDMV